MPPGGWPHGSRSAFAQGAPNLGPNRLVTLGTRGGPAIRTGFTPSPSANLIVFDSVPYVIDTGYGTSFKLVASKFPLPQLRYTFITHHHSDHNAEFGLLVYNSWVMGLKTPIDAYGPAGMNRLAQGFWDALQFDIETRIADEGRPDLRKLVNTHEYADLERRTRACERPHGNQVIMARARTDPEAGPHGLRPTCLVPPPRPALR